MFFPKCHQFTYYYCKQVSLCHKLFKYKIINRVTIYRAKFSGIRTLPGIVSVMTQWNKAEI